MDKKNLIIKLFKSLRGENQGIMVRGKINDQHITSFGNDPLLGPL